MSETTLKTRIRLKCDIEANWNKTKNFIPLKGEAIIYLADINHTYPRVKIGDGITDVKNLPFIDAGSINGVDINNIEAAKVKHKLTFGANGAFQFDGSEDVTVPVYTGEHN